MISFNWEQVNAWRLTRHYLVQPAEPEEWLDVVRAICGLHAQLMSAAELQLSARVRGLSPADVQSALWEERTLVKSWAMRGTLHLLAASEYPLYVAALSTLRHFRRGSWLKYHGVTLEELEALLEGVRAILSGEGMTREALAEALAERTGAPKLRELLRSGWGALLKPAAFQGDLCFGPNQGQNVTFVRPQEWLREWRPVEPAEALAELARRYLTAYGPATSDEFARWVGLEPAAAKRVFRSLGDEIETVEVEDWEGVVLASVLPQMSAVEAPRSVRLLPHFDPYVVTLARQSAHLLSDEHRGRVYRPQGWISPVVLVDGRMEGVWEYEKKRAGISVTVEMFAPPNGEVRAGIEAEAARLGAFLGGDVMVDYVK